MQISFNNFKNRTEIVNKLITALACLNSNITIFKKILINSTLQILDLFIFLIWTECYSIEHYSMLFFLNCIYQPKHMLNNIKFHGHFLGTQHRTHNRDHPPSPPLSGIMTFYDSFCFETWKKVIHSLDLITNTARCTGINWSASPVVL